MRSILLVIFYQVIPSSVWRIQAWRAWRLPGRWPDSGRKSTVARWTRRRAAPAYASTPDLIKSSKIFHIEKIHFWTFPFRVNVKSRKFVFQIFRSSRKLVYSWKSGRELAYPKAMISHLTEHIQVPFCCISLQIFSDIRADVQPFVGVIGHLVQYSKRLVGLWGTLIKYSQLHCISDNRIVRLVSHTKS